MNHHLMDYRLFVLFISFMRICNLCIFFFLKKKDVIVRCQYLPYRSICIVKTHDKYDFCMVDFISPEKK
jgi:hypothetical protein